MTVYFLSIISVLIRDELVSIELYDGKAVNASFSRHIVILLYTVFPFFQARNSFDDVE